MAPRLVAVWLFVGGMAVASGLPGPASQAAEDRSGADEEPTITNDEVVIKHEAGHQWLLPRDWPVVHRNGVFSPASVEEYLSKKFDQVRDRFAETDQRLELLAKRLDRLEADQKIMQQRLRLLEERAQPPAEAPAEGAAPPQTP